MYKHEQSWQVSFVDYFEGIVALKGFWRARKQLQDAFGYGFPLRASCEDVGLRLQRWRKLKVCSAADVAESWVALAGTNEMPPSRWAPGARGWADVESCGLFRGFESGGLFLSQETFGLRKRSQHHVCGPSASRTGSPASHFREISSGLGWLPIQLANGRVSASSVEPGNSDSAGQLHGS